MCVCVCVCVCAGRQSPLYMCEVVLLGMVPHRPCRLWQEGQRQWQTDLSSGAAAQRCVTAHQLPRGALTAHLYCEGMS